MGHSTLAYSKAETLQLYPKDKVAGIRQAFFLACRNRTPFGRSVFCDLEVISSNNKETSEKTFEITTN